MSMIGFSIKKDKNKKVGGGLKEPKMKVMEELDTQSHLRSNNSHRKSSKKSKNDAIN